MHKILKGVHYFYEHDFVEQHDLFEKLKSEQHPRALFITCSDSRVVPCAMTHTEAGDLFVLRNAGNVVPVYDPQYVTGEAATIEYALTSLKIKDIILCGHSHCGAVKAHLEHPKDLAQKMPQLNQWLDLIDIDELTIELADVQGGHLTLSERSLEKASQFNVLRQLEHLKTHPAVEKGLADGTINLHAWYYCIHSGEISEFSEVSNQFEPLVLKQHVIHAEPVSTAISTLAS